MSGLSRSSVWLSQHKHHKFKARFKVINYHGLPTPSISVLYIKIKVNGIIQQVMIFVSSVLRIHDTPKKTVQICISDETWKKIDSMFYQYENLKSTHCSYYLPYFLNFLFKIKFNFSISILPFISWNKNNPAPHRQECMQNSQFVFSLGRQKYSTKLNWVKCTQQRR